MNKNEQKKNKIFDKIPEFLRREDKSVSRMPIIIVTKLNMSVTTLS